MCDGLVTVEVFVPLAGSPKSQRVEEIVPTDVFVKATFAFITQ